MTIIKKITNLRQFLLYHSQMQCPRCNYVNYINHDTLKQFRYILRPTKYR